MTLYRESAETHIHKLPLWVEVFLSNPRSCTIHKINVIRNVTIKDTSFVLDDIDVSHIKKKKQLSFCRMINECLVKFVSNL